jgi:hypothetical protein
MMGWDLPTEREKLHVYVNKARNDWIPMTLGQEGVLDVATYENPMGGTPQILVVIHFADMASWQAYVASPDNRRVMRELHILGCDNISNHIWMPSKLTPEPVKRGEWPGT